MLKVPIEAEIDTEKKLIKGLTIRQACYYGAAVAVWLGGYALTKDFSDSMVYSCPFVLIIIGLSLSPGGIPMSQYFKTFYAKILYRNIRSEKVNTAFKKLVFPPNPLPTSEAQKRHRI